VSAQRQGLTFPCKREVGRVAAGRGSSLKFSRTLQMTKRARRLRRESTDAERKLWQALRREQIKSVSFRRQHPIGAFTLDFYALSLRLGIEIDGGQHATAIEQRKDRRRAEWLSSKGVLVVRFWNNDVLGNLEGVLIELVRIIEQRSSQTPSPTLPLAGGGSTEAAP
jgi:very-short-patch-repair endonuclease